MEAEFSSEVETHLALLAEDLARRGLSPEEARREARRQFGGVAQIQELHREGRGIAALDQAAADLRYALRMMRRNPGFSLVSMLTLALGIGVNTTLFSAYNAVALKRLPVADPQQVVRLERWFASRARGGVQYAFSYPEYLYLRDHARSFADMVAFSWPVRTFAEWRAGRAERLYGQLVSANYFAAMGVPAHLGRTFAADEDRAQGGNPVVVVSTAAWRRLFQGDPQIVGRIVKLNGTAFTVIGVTPEDFSGTGVEPVTPDFWTPLSMQAQVAPGRNWLNDPNGQELQLLARLQTGVPMPRAQAEAFVLLKQFATTHVERDPTVDLTLQRTSYFGNTEDPRFKALVAALMLVVGLVLLVACANIANMLLARGAGRQREIGRWLRP
jgi:predicted permease